MSAMFKGSMISLDEKTKLVETKEGLKIVQTLTFPKNQTLIFDFLMAGKEMTQIEEEMMVQVKTVQKELDRLKLMDPQCFEVYEVKKIAGGMGWQIDVLKSLALSLKEFEKYHTLSALEERLLIDQVIQELQARQKAGLDLKHVDKDSIYLRSENEYFLDWIGEEKAFVWDDLADLVSDPELKEALLKSDVWNWKRKEG